MELGRVFCCFQVICAGRYLACFLSNPRAIEVVKDKTILYVCVATGTVPLVLPCVALSSGVGGGGSFLSWQVRVLREHTTTLVSFIGNVFYFLLCGSGYLDV